MIDRYRRKILFIDCVVHSLLVESEDNDERKSVAESASKQRVSVAMLVLTTFSRAGDIKCQLHPLR